MNSVILIIDTAHSTARVILADDHAVLAKREWANTPNVGTDLLVYIGEVLEEAGINKTDITRIGVHRGPGSYGLIRTGITTAIILAQGVDAELVGGEGETAEDLVENIRKLPPVSHIEPKYSQTGDK